MLQVMFTRVDSILSVSRPDGTRIVDHTDGTRITTFFNREGNHDSDINPFTMAVPYCTYTR